jgi:hypothetical protein
LHTTLEQTPELLPLHSEEAMPAEETLDINQLRDRGWTRQMVTRFLGVPDARRPATRGGGGRPAELFRVSRVRNVERMVAFSEARRTAQERSTLARRSQEDRRASVLRFASCLELILPDQDIEDVMRSVRATRSPSTSAGSSNARDRAVRLLLGMLRDSSTRLDVFQGQPGIRDARALLFDRKLSLISSRYPALADSCQRVKLEQTHENDPSLFP